MRRLLLHGGHVLDGTGTPPARADILIENGRIRALLPPGAPAEAAERIDVAGRTVMPGFIDLHSHSDLVYTLPPARQRRLLEGRIRQGITTEIVGNCGLGRYPCTPASAEIAAAACGFLCPEAAPDVGTSVEEYLAHLARQGVVTNVGTLVPHGPLKLATTGPAARAADAPELAAACRLLDASLAAGAFGISFGLIYAPGLSTPTDEICVLAARARGAAGMVAFHQRSGSPELLPDAIDEILEVARRTGAHVHLSHEHAQGGRAREGVEMLLAAAARALADGCEYTQDVIPSTTVHTTLLAVYPPWSLAGGVAGWLAFARSPEHRRRMRDEIARTVPAWPPWEGGNWPTNLVRDAGYDAIRIVECRAAPEVAGASLPELAARRGAAPFDVMTDLLIASEGQVTMRLDGISGTIEDETPLERLIAAPGRALITDAWEIGRGAPHPGAYGAFPKVFRRYVRERRILDLPEAVRKLTSLPAAIVGLKDRGVVAPGAWADLAVAAPEAIRDRATEDAPRVFAEGIDLVLVNGEPLLREGALTPAVAGKVLRHGA